ncbi:MAG: methyltransferase [Proteiniphilum sp.]|nr:methyltransferase [Proteiniphilum sp.]
MSNPYFRFKQFVVHHDKCAMKVGTDGVLLGAWSSVANAKSILDVGTGAGLIAMMVAQRNPCAKIMAVDIDMDAVKQAKENVINSPFSGRIDVELIDFRMFAKSRQERFDLIVSNPPYFSNSFLPADSHRTTARHSVSMSLEDLLVSGKRCLNKNGVISMILPYDKISELEFLCDKYLFRMKRKTIVYPLPNVVPKRILVEITLKKTTCLEADSLTIETSRHQYTEDFTNLARSFYLYL